MVFQLFMPGEYKENIGNDLDKLYLETKIKAQNIIKVINIFQLVNMIK